MCHTYTLEFLTSAPVGSHILSPFCLSVGWLIHGRGFEWSKDKYKCKLFLKFHYWLFMMLPWQFWMVFYIFTNDLFKSNLFPKKESVMIIIIAFLFSWLNQVIGKDVMRKELNYLEIIALNNFQNRPSSVSDEQDWRQWQKQIGQSTRHLDVSGQICWEAFHHNQRLLYGTKQAKSGLFLCSLSQMALQIKRRLSGF